MGILLEQCAKFNVKLMDERIALHHQISDEAIENLKAAIVETIKLAKALPPGYGSKVLRGGYGSTSKK